MFIFNAKTHKISKPSLLIITGFALLTSVFIGLLSSTSAMAAMNSDTQPSDRAASYSYWKATSKCVTDHMRSTIHTNAGERGKTKPTQGGGGGLESTQEGEWFDDLTAWGTVYPANTQDCYQIMSKALKLWGWTDYGQFLKDMGYTFDDSIPAYVRKDDNGQKRFDAFKSAVLSKVGNVVDLLDNASKYALYMGIFNAKDTNLSTCSAKRVGLLSAVDSTQSNAAKANQFRDGVTYTVLTVVENATPVEYVYTYSASKASTGDDTSGASLTTYASTWNYRGSNYPGGTGEVFSCKELVTKINAAAPSFALWNQQHPENTDDVGSIIGGGGAECSTDDSCEAASSCTVEGVGWIVCPVLTFIGGVVDGAYTFVAGLLQVQPLVTTGDNPGVYEAWSVMRNFANVAFVIAFLIIIFAQLTGMGVSNYGVKKLLPRLVIAAILVNLSFWVCAIAIDLSNIIGSSVVQIFNSIEDNILVNLNSSITETGADLASGGQWTDIVGFVIAGGAAAGVVYYVGLAALIPAILAALVAVVTVFLVLTLRQALIILLVVVAPLAFVAYLLPNTEDMFTKWRKLFTTLLLMYPIIAGIFGASALASVIVMQSAPNNFVVQIMGACIAILPLAITPVVMRTAGGVLNRFAGIVNNAEKGPVDRLKNVSRDYSKSQQDVRNKRALLGGKGSFQGGRGAFVRWRSGRKDIASGRESEARRANTEFIAKKTEQNANFRNAAAGGTLFVKADEASAQRVLASAINAKTKLEADELSAATVVLRNAKLDRDQVRIVSTGGTVTAQNGTVFNGATSTAVRAAAIQTAVQSNDVAAINTLWNQSKTWEGESGDKLRTAFADGLQSSSARPTYIGQGAMAALRINKHDDITKTVETAINVNAYSSEKIANADNDELNVVAQVLSSSPNLDPKAKAKTADNATKALNDERLSSAVSKNIKNVENISLQRKPKSPIT